MGTIDSDPGRSPRQLVELQAGVWADRGNQVRSYDSHPSERRAVVTRGRHVHPYTC